MAVAGAAAARVVVAEQISKGEKENKMSAPKVGKIVVAVTAVAVLVIGVVGACAVSLGKYEKFEVNISEVPLKAYNFGDMLLDIKYRKTGKVFLLV